VVLGHVVDAMLVTFRASTPTIRSEPEPAFGGRSGCHEGLGPPDFVRLRKAALNEFRNQKV